MSRAFAPLPPVPDHPALERSELARWDAERTFERLRERTRGGPRWSFVDGPITANNPMGAHHCWGRTLKDVFQRYKALQGFDQRAPFDALPAQQGVEHVVIPWDEVSLEEGTGIVHIAPGCGAEDFELSRVHGLPVLTPVNEDGRFYPAY